MTANQYGPVDKVSKSGDTMTGTLTMQGSPPINVPAGSAGQVMTSDGSGNVTLQPAAASPTLQLHTTTVTTTYTAQSTDFLIEANATSAAFTVTLPSGAAAGTVYAVKKIDSSGNTVTVAPASGTIDGAASVPLNDPYDWLMLLYDGTNWAVLAGIYLAGTLTVEGTALLGAANIYGPLNMESDGIFGVSYVSMAGLTGATAGCRYVGATASGHPTSGTFAAGDLVIAQNGKLWFCTAAGSPGTWIEFGALNTTTGNIQASPGTAAAGANGQSADAAHVHGQPPMFAPTGLTGAAAASRYVGATASGAPASGTFVVGDWTVDETGGFYVCTIAGSPGTWVQVGHIGTSAVNVQPSPGTAAAGGAGVVADMGHVHGQPAMFAPTGLTGATAASRYVGATTSGAPSTGTFAVGDHSVDQSGALWICTAAGSPGTWTKISGGGSSVTKDVTLRTVTAAALTQLSGSFSIPASSAAIGSTYRLTAWGYGTWGSTAQGITFQADLNGVALGFAPFLGSGNLSTSEAFVWRAVIVYQCVTTGGSGTWTGFIDGIVTQTANTINSLTASQNAVPFSGSSTATQVQSTTVAIPCLLAVKWGSTTGAPTISCLGSMFEPM